MKILSPAKVNLFLQVVGKRPDGYHDLVTLMCCVGLYDTVSLTFGLKKTDVSCGHPDVPEDETNLAFAAADLFLKTLKKNEGVGISIDKKIPVAAGLGGGSSNAAAVLLGLNQFYNYPFSRDQLMTMGLSIGADVPFFIFKKPALARGIGEKLIAYQLPENLMFLLISPGFSLATASVYKNLNLGLTKCKKKLRYTPLKMQGFDVRSHLCNDLETVVASKHPDISAAKEALLTHGAMGALMSGSGPTVFGLFSDVDKARRARHALAKNDHWQIYLAGIINPNN
jgi:4-diphosphocytidyl-2-C-methyl-D-erythritol kinase